MRTVCLSFVMGLVCAVVTIGAVQASKTAEDKVSARGPALGTARARASTPMSIARDDANKLGGTIQTMPDEGGGYSATFKSVAVDGDTVTISYDSPAGDAAAIQLAATTDGVSIEARGKRWIHPHRRVGHREFRRFQEVKD